MQVIIPCGGRSSRYPTTRPKFLLTMPDGRPMYMHAADPYIKKFPITFVVVADHCKQYDAANVIKRSYNNNVNVVVLDKFANGPADTVYQAIKDWPDIPFISHDCDGFFNYTVPINSNFVTIIDLQQYPKLTNIAAKSFAISENGLLKNVVEKHIVSSHICVGAYGFDSTYRYKRNFETVSTSTTHEVFLSHIIKYDLDYVGTAFKTINVDHYIDCGTYDDFIQNSKRQATIFSDIDGVIFKNQSLYFENNYNNKPEANVNAVKFLLAKQQQGATVIFTTSRPSRFKHITETSLIELGFNNPRVVYDLPHAPRILINDVSATNPWPSASAINAPRDDDNFWKSLL